MKIAITTDSSSGISQEESIRLGISVIPIGIGINGKNYSENVDIKINELCDAIIQGKKVTTSMPIPTTITDVWNKLLCNGYEKIIHIPISNTLSSSYNVAKMLAEQYYGKVIVANNHRLSIPLKDSVMSAKRMIENGYTAEQTVNEIERVADKYKIYITVESLDMLKAGGRISAFSAVVGTILGIKPILSINNGIIRPFSKQKGFNRAIKKSISFLQEDANRLKTESNEPIKFGIAGVSLTETEIASIKSIMSEDLHTNDIQYADLPASLLVHLGIKVVGIGVYI